MRRYLQQTLMQGTAVSGTGVYVSDAIPIASFNVYAFQVIFTGSPTATVSVEQSCAPYTPDYLSPGVPHPQPTSWTTVNTSSAAPANYLFQVSSSAVNWVRFKWTNTSGTGTITAVYFVAKGYQT